MNIIKTTALISLIGAAFASLPAAADRIYIVKHGADKREHHRGYYGHHRSKSDHRYDRKAAHRKHRRNVDPHPTLRPHISLRLGNISYWQDRHRSHWQSGANRPIYRKGYREGYDQGYDKGYRKGYRDARRKQHHRARKY